MGNSKHTPGPWVIVGSNDETREIYEGSTSYRIALVEAEGSGDLQANARLIVAAPMMLRQLELLAEYIDGRHWTDERSDAETIANIKEIISKATGGAK